VDGNRRGHVQEENEERENESRGEARMRNGGPDLGRLGSEMKNAVKDAPVQKRQASLA